MAGRGRRLMSKDKGLPSGQRTLGSLWTKQDSSVVHPAEISGWTACPLRAFNSNPAPSFKSASELLAETSQSSDQGGQSRLGQENLTSGRTRKMKRLKQEKADGQNSRQSCIVGAFKAASVSSSYEKSMALPREVWQHVISFLPRVQVLRNVRGVCREWRQIVDAPSFLPHGKRFQTLCAARGLQSSAASVALVNSWLLKSDLTTFAGLVSFLQKEPFSTSPTSLLPALKASRILETDCHSTFLQDWSSFIRTLEMLSDRLSYTVWCLVLAAVLLVCNGSVLRALVTVLVSGETGACPGDAMEFVHLILTALTSSCWKDCQQPILREIETALIYSEVSGENRPGHFFTNEQQEIICTDLSPGQTMIVKAFAGAGKTSTLIQYTKRRPELRFAYLSFNRSVISNAEAKFPVNTKCTTFHKLAYSKVGWLYRHKFHSGELKPHMVTNVLNFSSRADEMFAITTLNMTNVTNILPILVCKELLINDRFLKSVDSEIMDHHVPLTAAEKKESCCAAAKTLWTLMKDKDQHGVPMTFSGYLKLYQLSKPQLDLQYDCLLLDEAQDATPIIADVVLGQSKCRKILVGDPHQQIYSFTGAQDAMQRASNTLEGVIEKQLTRSFRFGKEISSVCNSLLRLKGEVTSMVGVRVGLPQLEPIGRNLDNLETEMPLAYIARTNAGVFKAAVQYSRRKLGFVGGIQSFGFDLMRDTWHLLRGQRGEIRHPSIRRSLVHTLDLELPCSFSSYQQMMDVALQTQDVELMSRMRIVERYQEDLLKRIEAIEAGDVGADLSRAEVIFSTAHKSKGLEFNTVALSHDFLQVSNVTNREGQLYERLGTIADENPVLSKVDVDDFNLVYVAASRAKMRLLLNSDLQMFLKLQEQREPAVLLRLMDSRQCYVCKEQSSGIWAVQIRIVANSEEDQAGNEACLCLNCAQQKHEKLPQVWQASQMIASFLHNGGWSDDINDDEDLR